MATNETVTLRDHFDRLLEERRRAGDERWDGHRREHVALALALTSATEEMRARNVAANEWRATVSDLKGEFATREYAESKVAVVQAIVDRDGARLAALEASGLKASGAETERARAAARRLWLIGLGMTVTSAAASLIVNWLVK
jgi:hypothetical protein